ncbi:hypothetical protein PFICI_00061 [Pestalotiopsis fici W106-1]|uniref:C2H2-type domain-containing protein n=1 Tax=Pestalotiopsis fici (strain W106-1 / CGMCC3.15140) TaxID=1229662 RepID=W3XJP1_PESFW|nr:uncharacterized protein PFICI_00061 [Pestalotiopsis fici W106-1]ETS86233.1 hypothetical protein PFICI_00061 [Pestalotiopsis fici W106-1]
MRPAKAKGEPEIASLVIRGRKALVSLVENLEPVLESKSKVGSHLARFNLWSASFAAHRAAGKRALEYRLRDASSVKNQILSLLRDLSTVIDQAQASARGQSDPSHDDPAYDEIEAYFLAGDSATQSPLDHSVAEIGHIVDCLLRLSATINNPAPHDQFQSRVGAGISGYFEPWDVRHVQEKFKDLDPAIAERLGKAVTMRRHYFRYREEHHHKLSEGLEDDNVAGGDETTVASSIPEHLKDLPGISSSIYLDNQSEFSVTSYAPSSAEPDQLAVPPIPQEHLEGPFLCPFCKMIIQIDTRREWKEHVFRDLRPYVCIDKTCPTPNRQYARRSEWNRHMNQDHWKMWYCLFGCLRIFPTRETWREHYTSTHRKEVTEQELKILEEESIHQSLDKSVGNCPFCMSVDIEGPRQYSSHIGHHLELLALFSLPSIDGKDEIDDEVVFSHETMPDDRAEHHDDSSSSAADSNTLLEAEPEQILGSISPQDRLEASDDFEAAVGRQKMEKSDKQDALLAKKREEFRKKDKEAREAVERAVRNRREALEKNRRDEDRRKMETELAAAAEAPMVKLMAAIKAKEEAEAEALAKKEMDEEAEW